MQIIDFKKVLEKSCEIIKVGIKKGYFQKEREKELYIKLSAMLKNGIGYDISGEAIYGAYIPDEKKLYFNAKVFKNEEEALIYVLHEIKHGLDHEGDFVGFEDKRYNEFTAMNEGATQRFATDIAEEMLGIKIEETIKTSLGIQLKTNLDEYQIEDKLNELFCMAMGISREEFMKLQNNPDKSRLNKIIEEFNKYANFSVFKNALDKIYKIQEETWFDENGNPLKKEKEATPEQTKRAIELIEECQKQILQYVKMTNEELVSRITENFIVAMNEPEKNIGGTINGNGEIILNEDISRDSEVNYQMIDLVLYLERQERVANEIEIKKYLGDNSSIVYVSEDVEKDVIYFRTGELYKKIILSKQGVGLFGFAYDFSNVSVLDVHDIREIEAEIQEDMSNFCTPEYIRILSLLGKHKEAQMAVERWNHYLEKENEIKKTVEEERAKSSESAEIMDILRAQLEDDALQEEVMIEFDNIMVFPQGITVVENAGVLRPVTPDEEQFCISYIEEAVENGTLSLTESQLQLLHSYIDSNDKKTTK